MAILPAYERGCRHGAPSRARCRERRDTARRVEAVEKLGEALDGVLATGDAVDAASLEVLLRRFEPAAHPEALLVAQAMTIDALAAGRPEAGRHFARAKSEAALFAAGRAPARGHYIAAADGLSQELAPPATAEDGRNAGLVAWAFEQQGLLLGNASLARTSNLQPDFNVRACECAAPAVAAALDAEGNGAAYAPLLLAACPGDARGAVAYADAAARAEANRAGGAVAASFAAAPANASGAALTQRNALYLGALLRCDAVPRFDGAARLEQLLEVPLQEASKRSWLPGETERLVRADAVAGLLAVAAEQPHGDAREVSLRLLRNLTAAWASAFAEDRARTYDFLESQGLAVTDLKEAPTVMAAHGPLVDLYNEHLARLPHDPRPKTLAKWRWGLARVVVRGGLRDTKPKALAKLAAFGFAAAATLVEGPEAGDAGLLALFADLGVLLEHVARYRPRGFLANLRDNDECIADFLDDCKRRRALLPAALTALAAWGRDRGLSRDD
ncbi:hypothetical protein SO694_00150068 [Aureococcus anophagefferens]|uniref:Uncharacterized protein n=1 Tax=Aureococcus anophagefferens TaxID=44056 RepID=A0ABR1GE78_AURAN